MASDDVSDPRPASAPNDGRGKRQAFDKSQSAPRSGSVGMVLVVALLLIAAAGGLIYIGPSHAETYILIMLAVLGTFGVFALFALASGIMRLSSREQSNPLIKQVVDYGFDGIVVTDQAGRVFYANATYLDLTGAASPDDVRPIERVFMGDPEVSEAIYRLLKAAREGRRLQEEVRIAGAPGEPARWLRLRVRPLGDNRRDAKLAVWSIADVTRERERHENVFQELQHAIDYLDHAPAGFFSVDGKGDIVYLNATLATWLDQDLAQIGAGAGALTLNDIVAGEGAALLTTLNAAPGEVRTEVLDLDLKTRGGRPVPVRLFHKVAYGADGTPGVSRTLVLNRGKDGGKDAQRDAEVRFMRFFQNTPMAIATVDKTGRVARHNARFATSFDGMLGDNHSILWLVNERDRSALEAAIKLAAGGQGDIPPVEAQLAGSNERWANFFVSAVEDKDGGDGEAAIVYALETTAQRTLENKVYQQQKMESVGQLAGGIAHDFNNVLSAIMMATDFLLNAHKPTDPSFQDIIQIKQNANRAAALVRQLLAFSRKQTLRPQVLDLGEVLGDLGMLLKRLIGEKVTFAGVKHGRDLWPVKADLSQFEQVIVNLAVNARDAMPDGGTLSISTSNVPAADCARFNHKGMPAADYVLVEVSDTGTGIPQDIIDKIFEPFFSTKEVGKGTGLGLSTVYGIVKQTGGYVYVDSVPGRTAFRIFLPRHVPGVEEKPATVAAPSIAPALDATKAAAESMAKQAASQANADLTGQGVILLVEDEEGLRALNARGLTSRGYTVLEAGNGVEAIEVLDREGHIDLVVSDVVMPEMDGPTLLRELRAKDPGIKFIFVSGYAEEAFAKNLPSDQQYNFLAKPFTLKQLVAEVKRTLSGE
ncbi:MAG: response regulator [Pseudolabrys sp.]|nr:response regulator [Pseudolabrys sp.]